MSRFGICVLVTVCLAAGGCHAAKQTGWVAEEASSLARFESPECAAVDPATGMVYIASRGSRTAAAPAEKEKAFITRLKSGGMIDTARWKEGTPELPLVSPRGMCIVGGQLYVADGTQVVVYPLTGDKPGRLISVPGAKHLAGMATDGTAAYVCDPAAWKVFRIEEDAVTTEIKAPPSVLGIAFHGRQMFAVSSQLRDVYDVDSTGKAEPTPFGLDKRFGSPLGIQVMDDGSILVSDTTLHQVTLISPDRKTVRPLTRASLPGQIAVDAKRKLLYIPLPESDRVTVYRLDNKK
jgi:DNA-binding beta-propeller fold protein YncE